VYVADVSFMFNEHVFFVQLPKHEDVSSEIGIVLLRKNNGVDSRSSPLLQ